MQLEDYSEFVWNNFYQVLLELRDKKRIYIRGVWNEENKDSTKEWISRTIERAIYRYKNHDINAYLQIKLLTIYFIE